MPRGHLEEGGGCDDGECGVKVFVAAWFGRVTLSDGAVARKISVERKSRVAMGECQIPAGTGFLGCGGAHAVYQACQNG